MSVTPSKEGTACTNLESTILTTPAPPQTHRTEKKDIRIMRLPNSGKLSQQVFWNKKIQAMRDRRFNDSKN
jgi:hypothetical protein